MTMRPATWVALLTVTLLFRITYAWLHPVIPRDGVTFLTIARTAAEGDPMVFLRERQHPLYPALASAAYWIIGDWERAGLTVSAIFSTLTVIPIVLLARRVAGPAAAMPAGWIFAASRYPVQYGSQVLSDGVHGFFFAFAAWAGAAALGLAATSEKPGQAPGQAPRNERGFGPAKYFVLAGIFSGMAYLARPEGLIIACALGLAATAKLLSSFRANAWPWARGCILLLAGVVLSGGLYAGYLSFDAGRFTLSKKKSVGETVAALATKGAAPASKPAAARTAQPATAPASKPKARASSQPSAGAKTAAPPAGAAAGAPSTAAAPSTGAASTAIAEPPAPDGADAPPDASPAVARGEFARTETEEDLDEKAVDPKTSTIPPALVGLLRTLRQLVEAIGYLPVVFVIAGLLDRRRRRESLLPEIYLLSAVAAYVLLECGLYALQGYTSRRHLSTVSPLLYGWGGLGVLVVARALARRPWPAWMKAHLWREKAEPILTFVVVLCLIPKTTGLVPARGDGKDLWMIEAGRQLSAVFSPSEKVVAIGEMGRPVFYSGAWAFRHPSLAGPADLPRACEAARNRRAQWVLLEEIPGEAVPDAPEGSPLAKQVTSGDRVFRIYRGAAP